MIIAGIDPSTTTYNIAIIGGPHLVDSYKNADLRTALAFCSQADLVCIERPGKGNKPGSATSIARMADAIFELMEALQGRGPLVITAKCSVIRETVLGLRQRTPGDHDGIILGWLNRVHFQGELRLSPQQCAGILGKLKPLSTIDSRDAYVTALYGRIMAPRLLTNKISH